VPRLLIEIAYKLLSASHDSTASFRTVAVVQRTSCTGKYISENKPALDLTQKIMTPSGEEIQVEIGFGVEFFRPFYGI